MESIHLCLYHSNQCFSSSTYVFNIQINGFQTLQVLQQILQFVFSQNCLSTVNICLYWLLGQYRDTLDVASRNSSIDTKSRKRWTSGTVIKVNHQAAALRLYFFSLFFFFSLLSENKENYFFLAKQNPKREAIEVYPSANTRQLSN